MTDTDLDWMVLANRKPKGKRPNYFGDQDSEQFYSILLALVGEVSVLRQRLDTVERLLEDKGTITRDEIDAFMPAAKVAAQRSDMTREYILRVMRGPMQAVEALAEDERPIDAICDELLKS